LIKGICWCDPNKPNLKCINKPKPTSKPNH